MESNLTRAQIRKLYPELTEKMSDEELDDLIEDLTEDNDLPVFARAIDRGYLPVIAIALVAIASVLGMLAAAYFSMPKGLT